MTIPEGIYKHQEFQFVLQTNPNKAINFYNRSVLGGYYGGDRIQLRNRMNLRLGDKFVTALNVNYNHLELENGTIDALVSGARLTIRLPRKCFFKVYFNTTTLLISPLSMRVLDGCKPPTQGFLSY